MAAPTTDRRDWHATIWRWHFYAGIIVIPFILMLSVTGSLYLFKPDWDRWEESAYRGLAVERQAGAEAQVAAALAASPPGTRWHSYRLPEAPGDAALVHVGRPDGTMRDLFVAPDGTVVGDRDPEATVAMTLARIHGSLLLGRAGGLIVEAAASWAILLLLTGLYLWWPRAANGRPKMRGMGGVLWPRRLTGRRFWRDIHAVTGFWVAGLALLLLLSGLPWTDVWANGFRFVRAELGLVDARPQAWKSGGGPHGGHDHAAMMASDRLASAPLAGLDRIVAQVRAEALPFPAVIQPPGAPAKFGPPNGPNWKATTETQNRPLARTILYDAATGRLVSASRFADRHMIDRVIGYGIAWHEGQLLGRFNQAVGVATALALMLMAVSGTILWWRRRPDGRWFAPPAAPPARLPRGWIAILVVAGVLLPMLGLSLLVLLIVDTALRRLRNA